MDYLVLKHLHLTCVALSGLGFVVRGCWMVTDSSMLARRAVRIVPHFVDSALLVSALALAVSSHQYPFEQPWLTAKLIGLLAYIALGTFALKRGKTKSVRLACFGGALAVYAYIVSVGWSRNPLGFFA